jgi:hypothetical protein
VFAGGNAEGEYLSGSGVVLACDDFGLSVDP